MEKKFFPVIEIKQKIKQKWLTNITNSSTNHANLHVNSKIHKIRQWQNANLAPSMGQPQKSGSVTLVNRKPIESKYNVFLRCTSKF